MNSTTASEKSASAPEIAQPKPKRSRPRRKPNPRRTPPAKKTAGKPKEDRANKRAEVIAMMKRAKGATWRRSWRHGLAGAHRTRLRKHPGQQGR